MAPAVARVRLIVHTPHVEDDRRPHVVSTGTCWCGPTVIEGEDALDAFDELVIARCTDADDAHRC
jgi:hypothetical protein